MYAYVATNILKLPLGLQHFYNKCFKATVRPTAFLQMRKKLFRAYSNLDLKKITIKVAYMN